MILEQENMKENIRSAKELVQQPPEQVLELLED
jgi:hypothetical protein